MAGGAVLAGALDQALPWSLLLRSSLAVSYVPSTFQPANCSQRKNLVSVSELRRRCELAHLNPGAHLELVIVSGSEGYGLAGLVGGSSPSFLEKFKGFVHIHGCSRSSITKV